MTSLAVYPLATPIIAGPGALLAIFLTGNLVERAIGQGGIQLLRRIMGLLLSALAVNLVLSAAAWLKLPPI